MAIGMHTTSNILLAASVAILALAATGCTATVTSDPPPPDAQLTVSNRSSYFIEEIHLAATASPVWGPDLVSGALAPGGDVIISQIACNTYDVMVVDETGVSCELHGLDLCFNADSWVINDVTLDTCAFNAAR